MSELALPKDPAAVLFDIDGTLVDSNYVHVVAWMYAFQSVGCHVEAWRIHEAIGMDSGELLDRLLGDRSDALGDQVKQEHGRRYAELSSLLQPFDGARELLRAVADRGVKVVLATSAPPEELERLRGLLGVEDAIETVTNAEDVDTAKPAPDIVQVALQRAEVDANEAIFVGDTVWDVQAASKAGVACIAVTSGGVHEAELRKAGAARLYPTVRGLLDAFQDGQPARSISGLERMCRGQLGAPRQHPRRHCRVERVLGLRPGRFRCPEHVIDQLGDLPQVVLAEPAGRQRRGYRAGRPRCTRRRWDPAGSRFGS